MSKFQTAAVAASLVLGVASRALAQNSATSPSNSAKPGASSPSTPQNGTTAGSSGSSMKMSEQDVKRTLEGDGYSQVSNVMPDSNGYTATAMKSGKKVHVDVDQNGKIKETKK